MELASWIAAVGLAVVLVFQLALALGAPWGARAWGGAHPGRLPRGYRIASAFAGLVLYPLILLLVLDAGAAVDLGWVSGGSARTWMWVLTAFFALGTLANAASRSRPERIWAPVSALIAVCTAIIALSI